jgi:hypothetical protein
MSVTDFKFLMSIFFFFYTGRNASFPHYNFAFQLSSNLGLSLFRGIY